MLLKKNLMALAVHTVLMTGIAVCANAQTDNAGREMEQVVVTGSPLSLNRSMMTGVGAVTVIDKDAIERSGATSVETLLQRMSASAGFAGNQTNAYWGENGYGTTQVNLRGLGANSSVDLNMIPGAMVQRIEVLKDGASAIYGADAVAGVVNLITKKGFDGMELTARYGQTTRDDARDKAVSLAWGITGERGSLMTAIDYAESGTVNMADRAPCGLREADGKLVCVGSSSTLGGRAVLADGTRVNFNQTLGGQRQFLRALFRRQAQLQQ